MWAGSIEEEGEEGEGGGGGRGGNGERSSKKGETPVQLKELLKTEREQKVGRFRHLIYKHEYHCYTVFSCTQNYFEELVSVRDNQLSRLQSELASVSAERERERAELELVILELQQQL